MKTIFNELMSDMVSELEKMANATKPTVAKTSKTLDDILESAKKKYGFADTYDKTNKEVLSKNAYLIIDAENDYIFELDAPGLDKSTIKVSIRQSNLIIKGKRRQVKQTGTVMADSRSQEFYDKYIIDTNELDTTKLVPTYSDGVIRITIPKKVKESFDFAVV